MLRDFYDVLHRPGLEHDINSTPLLWKSWPRFLRYPHFMSRVHSVCYAFGLDPSKARVYQSPGDVIEGGGRWAGGLRTALFNLDLGQPCNFKKIQRTPGR